MKNCVLICAGEPDLGSLSRFIYTNPKSCVVCAEGGGIIAHKEGVVTDLIIGDFDSLHSDPLEFFPKDMFPNLEVITLPKEKDDTDTLAAIREIAKRGFTELDIFDAAGGRIDHYIANMQCLLFAKRHGINARIRDCNSYLFVIENETAEVTGRFGTVLSVFSMGDLAKGVTIKNLKYEVEDIEIKNDFPIGVSNEFLENNAVISVKEGALLVYVHDDSSSHVIAKN